ncbi:UvrD-helicase domain-containing protein [Sulfitobacter sp. 1A13353]|uniref:UvrD-helicase domain-containing protein n=1 Tax=Sulfitobacter sp. 1A13353 TaxID=3368568 RepID=UPI003745BA05
MTIQIVGAGAGSGKTYHIQETLKDWVADGTVRPERILAVTFTEAAAAELKGRVRAALLEEGRVEEAAAVQRAYVSTIHSLGRRLLTEHAFAAGLSPALRLIEDAEAELLLRRAIAETEALAPITSNLAAHGYAWSRNGGSATEAFRADLRAAVSRLNELGVRGDDPDLPARARRALETDWPEVALDGIKLDQQLRAAIDKMLAVFPDGIVDWAKSAAAKKDFSANARDILRGSSVEAYKDWTWWQRLRSLRLAKRGAPTPEGYDDLAEAIMNAAGALLRHPGPKEQAAARLEMLITGAQDVRRRYAAAKAKLGVIDFGDMIAQAEALLRDRPDATASMLDGVDCVIVDEFQDTNPVQFALLSHLIAGAPRVILVGDGKQAIMGFQGADARLAQALARARPEAAATLDRNWRSVPEIMALVNDLGARLFESYEPLEPQRKATAASPPLEVLRVPKNRAPNAKGCHHVADRIRGLLAEGREIEQRNTKIKRPLTASDIAILCRTHADVMRYADCLTQLGIPVDVTQDGWNDAPAIVVARAALAFIADPQDLFSALVYLSYGPARLSLEEGLTAVLEGNLSDTEMLVPLIDLHERGRDWPVSRVLAELRVRAGLDDWAASLSDAFRTHADLARLDAEAIAFEATDPTTRAASGVFGWDIRSFLSWLAIRIEAGENRRPDPGESLASGVRVLTWHAAKGLEWPAVFVTGLGWTVEERPNTLRIEFDGWDKPETLLERATLHYHPEVAAPEVAARFADTRRPAAADSERCLAYVALTRARDLLVIEWPDWCKPEHDTLARLLQEEGELNYGEACISVGDAEHPARIHVCSETLPDCFEKECVAPLPRTRARPGRRDALGVRGTPLFLRPSDAAEEPAHWSLRTHALGSGLTGAAAGSGSHSDAAERGTALHLAFRVLMQRPDRMVEVGLATGLPEATMAVLAQQADALVRFLDAEGLTERHHELPLDVTLPDSTRIRGTTDLLARSADGRRAALIDFKSAAPADPLESAQPYLSQLDGYLRATTALCPELEIDWAGIHFMGSGSLVWGHQSVLQQNGDVSQNGPEAARDSIKLVGG